MFTVAVAIRAKMFTVLGTVLCNSPIFFEFLVETPHPHSALHQQ